MFAAGKVPMIAVLALVDRERIRRQAMLGLGKARAHLGRLLVGEADFMRIAHPAFFRLVGLKIIICHAQNLPSGTAGAAPLAYVQSHSAMSCDSCAHNYR